MTHSTCCKAKIKTHTLGDVYSYCDKCGRTIPTPPPVPDKQHVADMLHTSSNATRPPPVPSEIEGEIREIVSNIYYHGINDGFDIMRGNNDRFYGNKEHRKQYEEENIKTASTNLTALYTHHTSVQVKEKMDEIVAKKFPRGERKWCIECAKRIRKYATAQAAEGEVDS